MDLRLCTAALPKGSGQWKCRVTPPHCLQVVGCETPAVHCHNAMG